MKRFGGAKARNSTVSSRARLRLMDHRFHINLFWHAPDESWVADVPDLKSCSAFGNTPEEALAEVQMAMRGWIEAAQERGLIIPEPRYRPAIYAQRAA